MFKRVVSLALGVVMSVSFLSASVNTQTTNDVDLTQVVKIAKDAGMSDAEISQIVEETAAEFGFPVAAGVLEGLNTHLQGFLNADPYAVVLAAALAIGVPVAANFVWAHGGKTLVSKIPGLNRLVATAPGVAADADGHGKAE